MFYQQLKVNNDCFKNFKQYIKQILFHFAEHEITASNGLKYMDFLIAVLFGQ